MSLINVNEKYFNQAVQLAPFFHYTSAEALKNIIEKSSIRFTHCAFLNDTEEYLYIDEIIEKIIKEEKDSEVTSFIKNMRGDINHNFKGLILKPNDNKWFFPSTGEYYVLSGTSEKDSLPMWNYYAKNGSYFGYAIKLEIRELYKMISPYLPVMGEFLCGKVIYDQEKQKQIVINHTRQLLDNFDKEYEKERDDELIGKLQDDFYDFVQRSRLFFKREGFKHEKELRAVVLTNTDIGKEGFSADYGITNGLIRPYIEYSFPSKCLPIQHIKLSPTIEEKIGILGVRTLINRHNYNDVDIDKSTLKLRF